MSVNFDKLRADRDKDGRLRYWEDVVSFGKHEGKTIRQIVEEDPEYLDFLIKRTKRTDFSTVMFDEIQEAIENAKIFDQVPDYWDYDWGSPR